MANEEQYLSYGQALRELGLDRSRLDQLIREGRLEEQAVLGETRFKLSDVAALKASLAAAPTLPPKEGVAFESAEEEDLAFELEIPEEVAEAELEKPLAEEAAASESAMETDLELETAGAQKAEDIFDFSETLEADFGLEVEEEAPEAETPVAEEIEEAPEFEMPLAEEEEEEIITAILETDEGEVADEELLGELMGAEEGGGEAAEAVEEMPIVEEEEITADITPVAEAIFEPAELEEELEAVVPELEEEFEVAYEAPLAIVEERAGAWPTIVLILTLLVLALAAIFMVENASRPEFSTHLTRWLPF